MTADPGEIAALAGQHFRDFGLLLALQVFPA